MKRILGMVASPRKLGNSEIMIKRIADAVFEPHQLKLLRLQDFNIKPCIGCYQCLFDEERCILEDDFQKVLDAILDADAVVLAAPTYFLGANAALKLFLDRGLAITAHIEALWGKPSVGVAIAGIPGKEGYAPLSIYSFLKLILAEVKGTALIYGALPGEIFFHKENEKTAEALGEALFGDPVPPSGPSCPLCGGDTFRFLGKEEIRCMTCSNSGRLAEGEGGFVLEIRKGDHEFMLTKEDALAHREWLRGMKNRFFENKKALKEICLPFRKEGEWIKP